MAQVKQAQGDLPAALRMVQLAEQSLHGSQWLTSVMAALQIRLALLQGSFDVNQCQHQTDMSESPCAKATGVLEPAPTLPTRPSRGGPLALVGSAQDFAADELWLWSDQSFGAQAAPLSLVG